jgi:hypothetical protein
MELLFLVLLLPVFWFLLFPPRLFAPVRRTPFGALGIVGVVLIIGWFGLKLFGQPASPAVGPEAVPVATADYAAADASLRALIE